MFVFSVVPRGRVVDCVPRRRPTTFQIEGQSFLAEGLFYHSLGQAQRRPRTGRRILAFGRRPCSHVLSAHQVIMAYSQKVFRCTDSLGVAQGYGEMGLRPTDKLGHAQRTTLTENSEEPWAHTMPHLQLARAAPRQEKQTSSHFGPSMNRFRFATCMRRF